MRPKILKEFRLIRNIALSLVFLGIVLWFIVFGDSSFLRYFTLEQQLTLALLMFAVYLWIFAPIPTGAGSLLLLALMLLFNLVDSAEEALEGFLSPALYFIFALSIVSKVLVKVGIDQVIAGMLKKISKGSPRNSIIGLPVFILLLPIILPSAIARFKMLLPLVNSMNKIFGFPEKSLFQQYNMYIIGMLNQIGTMVIITGGGFSVLAAQLFRDYDVAELGWIEWFC